MYNNPYMQGGQTWHNNAQDQRNLIQNNELRVDLRQIYNYYIMHPFCKYHNIPYGIFKTLYTDWLNKQYK